MRNFLRISCTFMAILIFHFANAQERAVSGKVTASEDGSPIPGVNVILKGTTLGTVTDFDGNYRLNVPSEGGALIFRFIGLTTVEEEIGRHGATTSAYQINPDYGIAIDVTRSEDYLDMPAKVLGGGPVLTWRSKGMVAVLCRRYDRHDPTRPRKRDDPVGRSARSSDLCYR